MYQNRACYYIAENAKMQAKNEKRFVQIVKFKTCRKSIDRPVLACYNPFRKAALLLNFAKNQGGKV